MKIYTTIIFLLGITFSSYGNLHLGPGQTYSNIQAAMDVGAIHPGDTLFLHAGSYIGYQGISKLKGNDAKWIVFTRYQNDEIDISGNWQFMSCEYIKFLNLNFKANSNNPGRLMNVDNSGSCTTQSNHIVFDSCTFSDVTDINAITAFKFGGVDDFIVKNCVFKNMQVCNAFDFNVCHNGLISNNRIENCLSAGHIKGGSSDITMERNLFLNASKPSWVAFELGGDTGAQFYCPEDNFEVKNLNFFSNIIVGGYRGLALSSARECKVINNTFYNCGQATLRFLTTSRLYPDLNKNIVENNIFAFGTSAYINGSKQPLEAATLLNNIYYSIASIDFNGPYWDTPALDLIREKQPINLGSTTILFVDGTSGDFNLIDGSPAIGKGAIKSEPILDFYGNPFSKTKRSIGAIEFEGNVGIFEQQSVHDQAGIEIFPNPSFDFIEIVDNNFQANSQDNDIKVYNCIGELIKIQSMKINNQLRLDISGFTNGIYFLKSGGKFHKFVKK